MKTAEQIFHNKLVHYNPEKFPHGMKKAFYRAMEEYAEQFKISSNLPVISCACPEEEKHGETKIWCCNHCGLSTEDWWGKH